MPEIDMEALGEELSVMLRASLAHPPVPTEDNPMRVTLQAVMEANPMVGFIAMPKILAGITEWASAIQNIAMAFVLLGIKLDTKMTPQTPFHKNLFGKGE